MEAILSTSINFQNAQEVEAYKSFSAEALPDGDRRYSGVDAYKVGFENIVLLDVGGYVIAKKARKNYKGFAINGEPITIHGKDFRRIGSEPADEVRLEERLSENVEQAVTDGMQYRVAWIDFSNNIGSLDFKDSTDAEAEYDARLKTEKAVQLRGLIN